jgi:hypothetical protein
MLVFLALTIPGIAILAGPPLLLMLIAGQLGRPRTVVAIGLLGTALVLYGTIDTYVVCNTTISVEAMENDETPCDVPFGFLPRIFIWFAGPIATALLLWSTYLQYFRIRRDS